MKQASVEAIARLCCNIIMSQIGHLFMFGDISIIQYFDIMQVNVLNNKNPNETPSLVENFHVRSM